jgi:isocitrate dehydrogenase
MIAEIACNKKAAVYAETLDLAISKYLENGKLPSRKVKEIDNRGSSFYLALYWAQTLAEQTQDADIRARFSDVAKELEAQEAKISQDLLDAQGEPADIGGYYMPDDAKAEAAMRPSPALNAIVDGLRSLRREPSKVH